MALIKCPECGKEFSDTANACPHCGYVMKENTISNAKDLGKGVKEGLKGLNTMASPKKKSTCIKLSLIPIVAFIVLMIAGLLSNDTLIGIGGLLAILSGACNFYVGKFKKGILYTFTFGLFCIGVITDLFRLIITNNFKDSNGFPVIY